MIYALDLLHQKLIKAEPKTKGICPDCKQEMVAKCGDFVIHHWSHKSLGDCDSKWEPTSQWHLEWQNTITNPVGGVNIEVPIVKTERYKRADMVAHTGMIIEFQKSPMSLKERLLREKHYGNMVWLIHFDISSSKTWKYNSPSSYLFVHDLDGNVMHLKNYTFQFKITPTHFIKTFINSNFSPGELVFDAIKARYNKILWNVQSIKYLTPLLFILLGEWEDTLEKYWYTEKINRAAKNEKEAQDKINRIRELMRIKKEDELTTQYRCGYPANLHCALQTILSRKDGGLNEYLELRCMERRLLDRLERERNGGKTKLELFTIAPIVNIKKNETPITNVNPNKIDVWDYKPSVGEIPLAEPQQKKVIKKIVYNEWFSLLRESLLAKGYVEVKL